MDCQFESCTCQNENALGGEGNGKSPHKIHFPRKKTPTPVSGFCYSRNPVCDAVSVTVQYLEIHFVK